MTWLKEHTGELVVALTLVAITGMIGVTNTRISDMSLHLEAQMNTRFDDLGRRVDRVVSRLDKLQDDFNAHQVSVEKRLTHLEVSNAAHESGTGAT